MALIDNSIPKDIRVQDLNNKLQCQAFVVIGFKPKDPFPTNYDSRNYRMQTGAIVRIVNVLHCKYINIGDIFTIPATGMMEGEFRRWWERSYPETNDNTDMCIFYYQKVTASLI